jgi:hypothetical protein
MKTDKEKLEALEKHLKRIVMKDVKNEAFINLLRCLVNDQRKG